MNRANWKMVGIIVVGIWLLRQNQTDRLFAGQTTQNEPDFSPIVINSGNGARSVGGMLQLMVPAGTMVIWASNEIPSGWLLCNGASIEKTSYPDLVRVLSGPSALRANLPDPQNKLIAGTSSSIPLGASVGSSRGFISTPPHAHAIRPSSSFLYGGDNIAHVGIDTTRARVCTIDGGGNKPIEKILLSRTTGAWGEANPVPVSNIQPCITMNYIIKT